jgi:myo-inositol-1(or 4)-monophosphatase
MNPRLQIAMRAARAAGQILHRKFDETREIRSKGKRDIVTDADYAADRAVREILFARFPEDRLLSEESDAAAQDGLWKEVRADETLGLWILDPLDGTTNYAHHQSIFCVSIALYQFKAVQIGVIYDPIHDELFAAERGRGATLNGRPIAVSTTEKFGDAVIGMEWARRQSIRLRTTKVLARMVARAMTARSTGSAALSLCSIAAGRLDAYFHLSLAPWDVAAGALIVEEAGGRVTTPTGAPWAVDSRAYVASNGKLHPVALRFFRNL